MEPVVADLKAEYGDKVEFIIADVDDNEGSKLAGEFHVHQIPAFLYLDKEGALVDEDVGLQSKNNIRSQIERLL